MKRFKPGEQVTYDEPSMRSLADMHGTVQTEVDHEGFHRVLWHHRDRAEPLPIRVHRSRLKHLDQYQFVDLKHGKMRKEERRVGTMLGTFILQESLKKDYRQVFVDSQDDGWVWELKPGGHWQGRHSSGALCHAANTPSDYRAIENLRSRLKRAVKMAKQGLDLHGKKLRREEAPVLLSFLNYVYLVEAEIDRLKKLWKDKTLNTSHDPGAQGMTTEKIIEFMADKIDPSSNKGYLQWLITQYKKQNYHLEDAEAIKAILSTFERKKRLLQDRDINKYAHVQDVANALDKLKGIDLTVARSMSGITHHPEGEIVYQSPSGLTVVHEKTKAAAEYYGHGEEYPAGKGAITRWCTRYRPGCSECAHHDYFTGYNRDGPMYVVYLPNGEKAQFHSATGQYRGIDNVEKGAAYWVEKCPELTKVQVFQTGRIRDMPFYPPERISTLLDEYFTRRATTGRDEERGQNLDIRALIQHPGFLPRHLDIIFNGHDYGLMRDALKNRHIKSQHLDKLFSVHPGENERVWDLTQAQLEALKHPKLETKHLDKVFESGQGEAVMKALDNPKVNPSHINRVFARDDTRAMSKALEMNKHLRPEHLRRVFETKDSDLKIQALSHPLTAPEHIEAALKSDTESVIKKALERPSFTDKEMAIIMHTVWPTFVDLRPRIREIMNQREKEETERRFKKLAARNQAQFGLFGGEEEPKEVHVKAHERDGHPVSAYTRSRPGEGEEDEEEQE